MVKHYSYLLLLPSSSFWPYDEEDFLQVVIPPTHEWHQSLHVWTIDSKMKKVVTSGTKGGLHSFFSNLSHSIEAK
jgi:hypothetical protein